MTSPAVAERVFVSPEHLELQLQRRVGSRVRDLRIQVRPEGIVLQGRANTYHAKQLAQHAAMDLLGQPIASNDIDVR